VIDQLSNVLTLQRGAFADSGNSNIGFVVGEDGLAHRQDITLGARSVNLVEVVNGLEEGDVVVISSVAEFEEYDSIRIVD
jgi:HlyD family secretion protein